MSEEPTRPSPQWQPPQAPQEPPTRVWQPPPQSPPPQSPPQQGPPPQSPPQQAPPPQSPPAPAWQAQQPQSPQAPAWQAQAPQDSPPSWPAQPPQDSPPWQGQGGYGSSQGAPAPLRRRRRRRWPWITLIVIVLVLVGADRGALVLTENAMASQFQSSIGLSGKPHVSIPGFPFLTQLAARDFNTVNVSATDETTDQGLLEIASLTATAHGMHIHGLNSAEIDQFTASALITFTALANAGGIPQGITLSQDGPNKIQATVNIGPISDSATVQVTQTGRNTVNVHVIDAGGIPTSILGSLMNFTITIPKLPANVSIQRISITQQGLMITASGSHVNVSQNS